MEVYPDEGDIDMYELMKVFYEVGYPYMLMPDHMPSHSGDTGGYQAFAGGYMYINALIQAVKDEYIEYITSCGKNLLQLIDDIIDSARIESKQLKISKSACNINKLFIELFDQCLDASAND